MHENGNGWLQDLMQRYQAWQALSAEEIRSCRDGGEYSDAYWDLNVSVFMEYDDTGELLPRSQAFVDMLQQQQSSDELFNQLWFVNGAKEEHLELISRFSESTCLGAFSPEPGMRFPAEAFRTLVNAQESLPEGGDFLIFRMVNLHFDDAMLEALKELPEFEVGIHHCDPIGPILQRISDPDRLLRAVWIEIPLVGGDELPSAATRRWLSPNASLDLKAIPRGAGYFHPRECSFCFSARTGERFPEGTRLVPALTPEDIAACEYEQELNLHFELPQGTTIKAQALQELLGTLAARWTPTTIRATAS